MVKIALVHDYIKEYGGAERVLEALHELYPDAPVYTSVFLPEYLGPHKTRFANWDIRTSFLQNFPFKAKLISLFRLLAPFAFKRFDFSAYDVIITSATGAYFPNSLHKKSATLISYCHTPPRYLYGYATARDWKKYVLLRIVGEIANHFLRLVDFNASQNVDRFIANSQEVKKRIEKFYRKEAIVMYPPVDIHSLVSSSRKRGSKIPDRVGNDDDGNYFLAGGRLAKPKHIDLIIDACSKADVPLKIFGKGFAGHEEEIKDQIAKIKDADKDAKIEFLGEVTDEEKYELMRNAKAYLFAGEDEDFGILPVEAMAAGIPVIAYRSGGVQETVLENKTGLFFDALTVQSLVDTLQKFDVKKFDPKECHKRAMIFSKERFLTEIQTVVASLNK